MDNVEPTVATVSRYQLPEGAGAQPGADPAGAVEVLTVDGGPSGPGARVVLGDSVVLVVGVTLDVVGASVVGVAVVVGASVVDGTVVVVAGAVEVGAGGAAVVGVAAVVAGAVDVGVGGVAVVGAEVVGAEVVGAAVVVVVGGRPVVAVLDPWMPAPAPFTARTSTV